MVNGNRKRWLAALLVAVLVFTTAVPANAAESVGVSGEALEEAADESQIETVAEIATGALSEQVAEREEVSEERAAVEEPNEEDENEPEKEQTESQTLADVSTEEQTKAPESNVEETVTSAQDAGEEESTDESITDDAETNSSAVEEQGSGEDSVTEFFEEETQINTEEIADEDEKVKANGFTPRTSAPEANNQYYKTGIYDGPCNCTYYAYGRAYELLGYRPHIWIGHAYAWWTNNDGYERGSTPRLGAIMCWSASSAAPYGHVAVVEAINGNGTISFSEASYNADPNSPYSYPFKLMENVSTNNLSNIYRGTFQGYIYLPGVGVDQTPTGEDLLTGGSRTIADGDYHIITGVDNNMCLDIAGPSKDNGGNAQIWHSIEETNQIFTVTWLGPDKGYKIVHKWSGKYLEVEGASKKRGANVQQWEYNAPPEHTQWWVINETDNGAYYTVQSKGSGFYLDVDAGAATDGTNVKIWEGNQSNAQKWRFVPAGTQTIANGDYHIVTEVDNNKCLSVSDSNVQINSGLGKQDSVFTVTYLGNGFYKIIHKQTNTSIDVAWAKTERGTNVQVMAYEGNHAQQWTIRAASNGTYYIQPRCSGHYLDVANGASADGTNVWTTVWMGGANAQKWKFVPYVKPKLQSPTPTIPNGAEIEKDTKIYFAEHGADEIYFTLDGTTPTQNSMKYSNYKNTGLPIPTQQTTFTLKAFGVKEGYQNSDIITYTYAIKQKTPSESETYSEESSSAHGSSSSEEGSSSTESNSNEESSSSEESSSAVESAPTEESSATGESSATPEDEDPQDGVKWHYTENKVTYRDLSKSGVIATNIKAKVYDGSPYKPAVKVTVQENGKKITLTEGTDYRVLYFNNTHAGTGSVLVRGNGVYKGTISKKFEIKKKPCKKLKIVAGSMLTGSSATPKIYVYDGAELLKENKDYTIDGITPNLTATRGTKQIGIIAAPDSDYEGITSAKITVYDADKNRIKGIIDRPENIKLSQDTYSYTGKPCNPTATVTVDGTTLTAGKDYTIKYQNNKEAGTAFAIITGKSSYAGSIVKEFTIKPSGSEFALKKPIVAITYNGKLQKPKITVTVDGKTLKQNKDYTLSYTNNLHATDHAKITVRGKGNYANIPTKAFYFTINPCHIKKASIKGKQASLLITYANHTLVEGVDYDAIYGATDSKGKISVTIKAKEGGSFTGEITKKIKEL